MVKQLFIRDFKNYKSPAFQNLLSTSAGLAANQKSERNIFFNALHKGIASHPGDPTKAIAKTIGILKTNRCFDNSEIIKIKDGLRKSGYFVPSYSIKEDGGSMSRSEKIREEMQKEKEIKSGNYSPIKNDISQTTAHREANVRHDKPMQQNFEARLQTIAKLPNQPVSK
jgi:hypothetical protein